MRKQTLLVSCTTKKNFQDTILSKSLVKIQKVLQEPFDIKWFCENKTGLSKMYNKAFKYYANSYERMVFIHDDVALDDAMLDVKLDDAMHNKKYDIVGLAGTLAPRIQHPALWHIMGEKQYHRGYAGHFTENYQFMTNFGVTPSRVAIVDGLFVAVNVDAALKCNWQWNENFDFHHYDIASCLDANKLGLKIGVYPINVFHASPGLASLEDAEWSKSNEKFLQLYSPQQK